MTTPSGVSNKGLSFKISNPIIRGGSFIRNLTWPLLDYSHDLTDWIGFDRSSISFSMEEQDIDEWIEDGLLRDIEVYNQDQDLVFNGFVNSISLQVGRYRSVIGPFMEIGNNIAVVFSTVDTSVTPPLVGAREKTDYAIDTDSQDRWGFIEYIQSLGGATLSEAEEVRDALLEELKDPPSSKTIGFQPGEVTISLEILGYYYFTLLYAYNQTAEGGEIDLSDNDSPYGKLQRVLQAEPNSYFSTDYTNIVENSFQVDIYENNDKKASQVLQELFKLGINSGQQISFGIYGDRKAYYRGVDEEYFYSTRVRNNVQRVFTYDGRGEVAPSMVRPGYWAFASDLLASRPIPQSNLSRDPRSILIDRVKFTVPDQVELHDRNSGSASQLLARISMGGV
jgi:hypothetical protein